MARNSLLADILTVWNGLVRMLRDPYQPERHYMRGPGPRSTALARVPARKR